MWGSRGVGLLIRATDIGTLSNHVYWCTQRNTYRAFLPKFSYTVYMRIDVIVSRPLLVIGFTVRASQVRIECFGPQYVFL